jgi:hypothetical protein
MKPSNDILPTPKELVIEIVLSTNNKPGIDYQVKLITKHEVVV